MPAGKTEQLAEIVRGAQGDDSRAMAAQLTDAGFPEPLCRLIPVGLALTRLGRTDAATDACTEAVQQAAAFSAEDLDGITTALMYNMINRISNGYELTPEWSRWRPDWLVAWSRRPAGWLLRHSMSFDNWTGTAAVDSWPDKVNEHLAAAGLEPWADPRQLAAAPHLAEVLCQLLAAGSSAQIDAPTRGAIDRGVLSLLGAERLLPAAHGESARDDRPPRNDKPAAHDGETPDHESAEPPVGQGRRVSGCRHLAERLTRQPWASSLDDMETLRGYGLSEVQILDVLFRLAVLNGLGRLDRFLAALDRARL